MENKNSIYVTQDKNAVNIVELSYLFNLAKGYRNTNQFLDDCGIYEDKNIIIDIINERFNPNLRVHHLRKIAQASENRVTLDQLASASGIVLNDSTAELKSVKVIRSGIYMCNMGDILDNEQGGIRPVVVLQNQLGNNKSTLSIVAPLTSCIGKNKLPTHVAIGYESGLDRPSEVLLEQITRVSKSRLLFNGELQKMGEVPEYLMCQIDSAIKKSMGLIPLFFDEAIAKEYLLAIKGIEDARRLKNTYSLQMAHRIVMGKFEEYCADYDVNHNSILNDFKEYQREKAMQNKIVNNTTREYYPALA
jgi:mRNA interferase MazF